MAISDHWHRVVKLRATIIECDPANNIVDVRAGDGALRRIMVWEVPSGFRWPIVGEDWSIYEQNGSWYLGDRINHDLDDLPISNMHPGDQRFDGDRLFDKKGNRLFGVNIDSLNSGDSLIYNESEGRFDGATISTGGEGGQSFTTTIGDGINRVFVIPHFFGTKNIDVVVFTTAAPYSEVTAEVERTDINNVTIRTRITDPPPTAAQYTVVVMGSGSPTIASLTIAEWIALPLAANWSAAFGQQSPQYRIDPTGKVLLRGAVQNTAVFVYGGANATFATLPAGARPPFVLGFDALAFDGGTSVQGHVRTDVRADGTIAIINSSDARITSGAAGSVIFLNNVEFDTDTVTNISGLTVAPTMDPWHVVGAAGEPAFQTTWTNFDAAGPTQRAARFRRDPFGKVMLEGVVKSGASATSIFTLPVGYRPVQNRVFTPFAGGNVPSYVQVMTDGTVVATNSAIAGANVNTFIYLDGIEFDTDAATSFPVLTRADADASIVPEKLVAFPHCEVTRVATAQPISNVTATAISWDTAIVNDFGMWSLASPTLITIPKAGRYLCEANVEWAGSSAVGLRALWINVSTTTNTLPRNAGAFISNQSVGAVVQQNICTPIWLPVGAQVFADVYQNTVAGTLNCGGPPLSFFGTGTNLRVSYLGP